MGPSCVIEEVTDAFDPTEFDKALGDMLIKHQGDAGQFIGTMFSFLKRKTNFFKEGDPKKRVLDAYKQVHTLKRIHLRYPSRDIHTGTLLLLLRVLQVTGEAIDGFKTGFLGGKAPAAPKPQPAASKDEVRWRH